MPKVLCVDAAQLPVGWPSGSGWIPHGEASLGVFLGLRFCFLDRTIHLEADDSWRQVIPYVLIRRDDGMIHLYRRTGGDERLMARRSIGFGGHVEEADNPWRNDVGSTPKDWKTRVITRTAWRELEEEAGIGGKPYLEWLGYIVSSASEVDRVHLGIVMGLHVRQDQVVTCKDGCESLGWQHPDWTVPEEHESWSRLVLTEHFKVPPAGLPEWASHHSKPPLSLTEGVRRG